MLLSFYIFAGICAFMVIVSLLTRHRPGEEQLPSLRQTYAEQSSSSGPVWLLWGVLAIIMAVIYTVFN
jgi:hypothetical protein